MKRKKLLTMLVVSVFALAGASGAWRMASAQKDPGRATSARPALTVATTQPESTALPLTLAANGSIAAWQEASIGSEISGLRLTEVRASVGDRVARGQVLATFARETVEADLAVVRAQVAEVEAALADAQSNAERARTLQTTGALSAQQIGQYLTTEQTTRARLETVRAQVRVHELRLKLTEVVAPDDGIISARTATVGAVANAGTELFRMVRQSRLEWRADVTAEELGRLKPGQPVKLYPASLPRDAAPIVGRVRVIGPTVDPLTRNALVYVDVPASAGGMVRAGMFARGEFELGTTRALTLPQETVVVRDGFNYVFKVTGDSRVAQTRVSVGRRIGNRIEIASGLAAGDRIVGTGAGFLNDGDLVAVAPPATPKDAAR